MRNKCILLMVAFMLATMLTSIVPVPQAGHAGPQDTRGDGLVFRPINPW